jgi:hypothetical protein
MSFSHQLFTKTKTKVIVYEEFVELVALVGSKGGHKPFLGVNHRELHKGATPQVSRPLTFP